MEEWRIQQDASFNDSLKSPLKEKDLVNFNGLAYFPIDTNYRIQAKFVRVQGEPFKMPTSTARTPAYQVYGLLQFILLDSSFTLPVYQNLELMQKIGYEDYLFLPFTDLTNAVETYGGGRYLDMEKSENEYWIIDFNKCYNPYCAYNDRYSCPIPPIENHMNIRVEAGVLKFHEDH